MWECPQHRIRSSSRDWLRRRRFPNVCSEQLPTHFLGYPRPRGRAGTRNYIVVVASVNCSATVVKAICRHFEGFSPQLLKKEIHGVIPITHGSGCAQATEGLGNTVLNRTLAGWIFHPNVVAAVVIGLGCEKTTAASILEARDKMGLVRDVVLEQFSIQDVGGTAAAIQQGTRGGPAN